MAMIINSRSFFHSLIHLLTHSFIHLTFWNIVNGDGDDEQHDSAPVGDDILIRRRRWQIEFVSFGRVEAGSGSVEARCSRGDAVAFVVRVDRGEIHRHRMQRRGWLS